jgi:hypothetical protein
LGWFTRGKVLENKEEERKMKQGGFFGGTRGICNRKPQTLF